LKPAQGLEGGCHCGGVRFVYSGELGGRLGAVTVCYCRDCLKAQGFAAAVVPGEASGFAVVRGGDLIWEYQSSPGKKRAFCGHCGSPIYSRRDDHPEGLRLRLGAFDEPPEALLVQAQIHTRGRPAWSQSVCEAPAYPGREPDRA
jgi:hypothetical protein